MRRSPLSLAGRAAIACALIVAGNTTLQAQQANPSAAAVGMDNNFVAVGQGSDAVAWNPAMLGLSRNPAFTLNLLTPSGTAGLSPISWNDFMQYAKSNDSIPNSVRHTWLNSVTNNGGETGSENGSMNWLALNVAHLAFSVSTNEAFQTNLNPGAFQAIMFGNAGNTGSLQTISLAGSSFRVGVFSTGAVSYGFSFGGDGMGSSPAQQSIGVTLKYVLGNFVAIGQDVGSSINASSVSLDFPLVMSEDTTSAGRGGTGTGADIGYAWRSNKLTVSAVAQNVFNSFKWDITKLESRAGTTVFNGTSDSTNFNAAPYSAAPTALQQQIADYVFKPAVLAGVAYKLNRVTTLTGDIHEQFGDTTSVLIGPKTQIGGGIEFRGIPLLPLRAGLSYITGGYSAAAGVGLSIWGYELGVSGLVGHQKGGNIDGFSLSVLAFR